MAFRIVDCIHNSVTSFTVSRKQKLGVVNKSRSSLRKATSKNQAEVRSTSTHIAFNSKQTLYNTMIKDTSSSTHQQYQQPNQTTDTGVRETTKRNIVLVATREEEDPIDFAVNTQDTPKAQHVFKHLMENTSSGRHQSFLNELITFLPDERNIEDKEEYHDHTAMMRSEKERLVDSILGGILAGILDFESTADDLL